uniref:arylamine N-acetyltransferase n=1 Tax=Fundulus heteroclitus TaxID=8078 RepID=A0A3Q2PDN6_FUNHE
VFRLTDKGDIWVLEKTGRKPVVINPEFSKSSLVNKMQTYQIYCFNLEPREAENFTAKSHTLQTDPASLFTNKSILSLQTPTGFKSLVGLIYSEVTYKDEEGVDVLDMRYITEDELDQVLKEQFNVRLQNKMKPANRKACYTI